MVRQRSRTRRRIITGQEGGRRQQKKYRVNPATVQFVPRQLGEKSRPFTAKYEGDCLGCGNPWYPGFTIQRCGQFYYHAECVK